MITEDKLLRRRMEHTRDCMRQLDVPAILIVDSVNILYATGAQNMTIFSTRTPARYLLLFVDGPAILFDYFGCEHLAEDLDTIDRILPALGLCHVSSGGKVSEVSVELAKQIAGIYRSEMGALGQLAIDRFPYPVADALRAEGFALTDADAVMSKARSLKLPEEMPYIREAMRRVEVAAGSMQQAIEPGRTEAEVWAEFQREFIAREGQYIATRLLQSGDHTFPYFQECGGRTIEKNELVCLDTDALGYKGYAVDFSRTFICADGKPSAEQRDLYRKAKDQLDWNAALIQPGAAFAEIADKAWQIPEEHQASRYYCIGHGLGMSGEFPNIPHAIAGQPYPLAGQVEPGMVICIESYIGSERSGQGVKLEDQLLVTETGAQCLSQFPFEREFLGADF